MIVIFFLIFALLLQTSLTSLPLVFLILFVTFVSTQKASVFFLATLFGLLLDMLLIRPIGSTGIFFLLMLFLVFLYEKKFEVRTFSFVIFFTFFTVFFESIAFALPYIIKRTLFSVFLSAFLFFIFSLVYKKKENGVTAL